MSKKTNPVVYVLKINDRYIDDSKHPESEVLFNHLHPNDDTLWDLTEFKAVAAAHSWTVKVRNATAADYEEE